MKKTNDLFSPKDTTMKRIYRLGLASIVALAMAGCVMSPRTGLVCPPGSHPGPEGHRCFAD
jgi:hypothetical protein